MLECELGGDERPRRESCFWDDHSLRQSRDDLIADREVIEFWTHPEWKMRNNCASFLDDRFKERLILCGIGSIDPGTDHSNRISSMFECDTMREGIDTIRTTTHDPVACVYNLREYILENAFCIVRMFSRSYDCEELGISLHRST